MRSVERVENLVRLLLAPGIGCVTVNRLLRHFGTSERILGASAAALQEVPGVNKAHLRAVQEAERIDPRPELELAATRGVRLLSYDDPLFPKGLLESNDPPFLLYVKGTLIPEDAFAVGVVGTRQASRYGREQAERFGAGLARAGFTVVSGLARGIDTFAHRGALTAGGRTIAVVGCGLEHIYPPENRDLFSEIAVTGAVVSEFPMDIAPTRDTFPRRNRIIAGMSLGVLVVEAPERSGALITAHQALELGREVFAIPGRIDQESASGCHTLIRNGAVLVREVNDIVQELRTPEQNGAAACLQSSLFGEGAWSATRQDPDSFPGMVSPGSETRLPENAEGPALANGGDRQRGAVRPRPALSATDGMLRNEEEVLQALDRDPRHIDEICAQLTMNVGEISATLMILELKGKVAQTPGKFFQRLV